MNTLNVEYRKVEALIPYARNPRTHAEDQIAKIAASIVEYGWTNPILVDGESGIIAGHGRLAAARKLGLNQVPVVELAHRTVAQKRALVIADNRLALDAGWDEEMLALELAELSEPEHQPAALVENMLLLRKEDFDDLLDRAAERGAERVLAHLGLENGSAAKDIRELRDLLEAWRDARRTAWQTAIKLITTGILAALVLGAAIKCELMGGGK